MNVPPAKRRVKNSRTHLTDTARTAPAALLALQCDVLETVASGDGIGNIATVLCHGVEHIAPGIICSVVGVDRHGKLYSLAAPSLPEAFSDSMNGVAIGPEVGSCGAAAFLRTEVEVHDIDTDPRWTPYKAIPLAAGLRACWSSPVMDGDGNVIATFAFYFTTCRGPDAFERQIVETCVHLCALAIDHETARTTIERTNQRFDLALSNMSQGLCFFDGDQKLIVANRRYSEIYGLHPDAIVPGTTLERIVELRMAAGAGPKMTAAPYIDWRDTVRTSDHPSDTTVELANGRVIAIHHQPMPDLGWVSTHEDITERRRAESQVAYMARHDGLTGLPNRILFHERLDQALAFLSRGKSSAVLSIDLDQFKVVNDTFGHPIGDRLLQGVADRLLGSVREIDTVTRMGGDEFAVLMTQIDRAESAGELAQRIIAKIGQPFQIDGRTVGVGASIGIAIAPTDGATPAKLLKSADTALYRAKLDARGTHRFFEPDMDARLQARAALELDLRLAIQNQEFELVYQPLYRLATNEVCALEALLRWNHPTHGLVLPSEFIPIAEETGLIVPIGDWVLQNACAEVARWPGTVKVAVNLSAAQFKTNALVKTVRHALAAAAVPATRLELEITEFTLLNNSADTMATLHALRDLGVGICMDDFGTGYSSLSYLGSFPFNKIKIDQSFIRDLSLRKNSIAIVRAVVGLGRSLGMTTTAEGVETQEQLKLLRTEGCDEVQGYLFSRPVSALHARTLVREAQPNPVLRTGSSSGPD